MSSTAAMGPGSGALAVAPGLLALGRQLYDRREYADAALSLQRCLRLAPADDEARRLLALSLVRTGDTARAASLLEPARRARTLDAATCLELVDALLPDQVRTAHRWAVSAVWADPDDALAQRRLEEVEAVLDGEIRRTGRHRDESRRPWWRRHA